MLLSYDMEESASRAVEGTNMALEALREGRVEQEPAFTDRMLNGIEERMNGIEIDGIRWVAKTFTDRGPGAQETEYGADFMGVVHFKLPDFRGSWGFLAQAKLVEEDVPKYKIKYADMQTQCKKMLNYSSESFVFLYSKMGISVAPAISVTSAKPCNPHDLYCYDLLEFFTLHFTSFIGDIHLFAPRVGVLKEFPIRQGLILTARSTSATADRKEKEPKTFLAGM